MADGVERQLRECAAQRTGGTGPAGEAVVVGAAGASSTAAQVLRRQGTGTLACWGAAPVGAARKRQGSLPARAACRL